MLYRSAYPSLRRARVRIVTPQALFILSSRIHKPIEKLTSTEGAQLEKIIALINSPSHDGGGQEASQGGSRVTWGCSTRWTCFFGIRGEPYGEICYSKWHTTQIQLRDKTRKSSVDRAGVILERPPAWRSTSGTRRGVHTPM